MQATRGGIVKWMVVAVALCVGLSPAVASAQSSSKPASTSFGIAARVSFLSGADNPLQEANGTAAPMFIGGLIHIKTGNHSAIQLSADYRSTTSADGTQRLQTNPLQASLLVYPIRGSVSIFALGGVGLYRTRMDQMANGVSVAYVDTSRFGFHAGAGAEIKLGKRFAIFADYRYTFVKVTKKDPTTNQIVGTSGFMSANIKASHQGAMLTGGLMLYF